MTRCRRIPYSKTSSFFGWTCADSTFDGEIAKSSVDWLFLPTTGSCSRSRNLLVRFFSIQRLQGLKQTMLRAPKKANEPHIAAPILCQCPIQIQSQSRNNIPIISYASPSFPTPSQNGPDGSGTTASASSSACKVPMNSATTTVMPVSIKE